MPTNEDESSLLLRQDVYDLRRRLSGLQEQLNTTLDTGAIDALVSAIVVVQEALQAKEAQLAKLDARTTAAVRRVDRKQSGVDWQVAMRYVPTSIYHLLDPAEAALVVCDVQKKSSSLPKAVSISAWIEGYSATAVESVSLSSVKTTTVRLSPTLLAAALRSLTELTAATIHVQVADLEKNQLLDHNTERVWLLARNSAQMSLRDLESGEVRDLSRYLGAYVTPNAPTVMHCLRKAVERHGSRQLVGYQGSESVDLQVEAIYTALQKDAKIVYVNSLVDFNPQEGSTSQRIRLPRESLEEKQANCIDGAVLFASLLEAASLNAAIVLVPRHAFVGWETAKESGKWRYLETTMIATNSFKDAVDYAESIAGAYEKQRETSGKEGWFRRWSLRDLRTKHQIWPLE